MKRIILCAFLCTSCQHWCVNYVEPDCDARVQSLRQELAKLKQSIARDKLAIIEVNEARCEDLRH